jgi:hypothetical protein
MDSDDDIPLSFLCTSTHRVFKPAPSTLPEYHIWRGMLRRCHDPHAITAKHYLGRGITVDPQWETFEQFYHDMGPRPSSAHSIDRLDNNGPYSAENCRWATQKQQMQNCRTSFRLTCYGHTRSLHEWSDITGIPVRTLRRRKKKGWSDVQTIMTPLNQRLSSKILYVYFYQPSSHKGV